MSAAATTPRSRIAYAAAHVIADPRADNVSGAPAAIDWDATMGFRHYLWSLGLRVAEAMDTAQRGMGLDWPAAADLIRRSGAEAKAHGDPAELIAAGAGTDHAPHAATLDEITTAYREQIDLVQESGARVIIMASRRLAAMAGAPRDYHDVYGRLLGHAERPVILHWLGETFDPALAGYWGARDVPTATGSFMNLVHEHAAKIDGVKVSLLDKDHEKALRRDLPAGVRLYTGDDFDYAELIKGDGTHFSHALLGIFDAIAPVAAAALRALDDGDIDTYDAILTPTVPLARKIFEPPTHHYKTGIVFVSWLAGHQDAFVMAGGAQSARSAAHLAEVYRLAGAAGLFPDPGLARARMRAYLTTAGVDA